MSIADPSYEGSLSLSSSSTLSKCLLSMWLQASPAMPLPMTTACIGLRKAVAICTDKLAH
jgi:hypothetical protein